MNTEIRARDLSWMTSAGYVLTCTAFVMPVIVSMLGAGNPVDLTASVPRALGGLLLIGGITFAIVRTRSERAKSIGVFVVGVLMCLLSWNHAQREAKEFHEASTFFQKALAYQNQRADAFLEFKQRFERFDLSAIVTPKTLSSPAGRAEGRARLAEYRALLAERKSLLETHFKESERFVNDNAPAHGKTAALEAMKATSNDQVASVYAELYRTQSAVADAMSEMLDWSDANAAKFKFSAEGVTFTSGEAKAQFNDFLAKIKTLDEEARAVGSRAEGQQVEAQELIRKNNATLQQLAK